MSLAASPILSGNDNFVRLRNALAQPAQDEAGMALHETSWGKRFHPASMSRVVRRLGFSRQKARQVHPQSDALAQAAFAKKLGRQNWLAGFQFEFGQVGVRVTAEPGAQRACMAALVEALA